MDRLIQEAARRMAGARRVTVLTGAGVSRESGLHTFRDPEDGLWARYDPMRLATAEAYLKDPELVWQWYPGPLGGAGAGEHRFGLARQAQPNPGHLAIAALEGIFPSVTVITQNIDGLHQRAGSSDVIELHGSIHCYRCLAGHAGFTHADFADQQAAPPQCPRCPRCSALIRPEVVWFGEMLPEHALARASDLSAACDAMLVVGTSGEVQPAASLPWYAAQGGALVVDVNPNRDQIAELADIFLQGPGGEVLPRLVAALKHC